MKLPQLIMFYFKKKEENTLANFRPIYETFKTASNKNNGQVQTYRFYI